MYNNSTGRRGSTGSCRETKRQQKLLLGDGGKWAEITRNTIGAIFPSIFSCVLFRLKKNFTVLYFATFAIFISSMDAQEFQLFKILIAQVWEKVNNGRKMADWNGDDPDFWAGNIHKYCKEKVMLSKNYSPLSDRTIKTYIVAVHNNDEKEANPDNRPLELLSRLALGIPDPNEEWYKSGIYNYKEYWNQFKQTHTALPVPPTLHDSELSPKPAPPLKAESVIPPISESVDSNPPFINRLRSTAVLRIVFFLIAIETVLLVINLLFRADEIFDKTNRILQCLFCVFAVFMRWKPVISPMPASPEGEIGYIARITKSIPTIKYQDTSDLRKLLRGTGDNIEHLYRMFKWIWIFWAIYFLLKIGEPYFVTELGVLPFASIDLLANMIPAMLFYTCYIKLDKPTTNIDAISNKWVWCILGFIVIYYLLMSKSLNSPQINNSFYLISGLANGVTMAMLAGRLESKLIGSPRGFIIAVFIYAALQTLIFLNHIIIYVPGTAATNSVTAKAWDAWIHTAAQIRLWVLAIGKCIFFWFTIWLYNAGTLVNYFVVNKDSSHDLKTFHDNKN